MATFVYAPAIRVHVESEHHGIIDISNDISSWELTRRSNAVSSFNFVLQNTQRKYDNVFLPSDRISVELKRITWMRVFTGTLNNVPLFSAWPRALSLSASCTLKKLQFWSWDPTTTESAGMIQTFMSSLNTSSTAGDSGMKGLIVESLTRVVDWDKKAIHIGAVPNAWFGWAKDTERAIDAASAMAAILGPGSTIGGAETLGTLTLPAGTYGDHTLSADQVKNAAIIYEVVVGQGGLGTAALQDRAATIAIMVAADESSLINNTTAVDHTSLGLFQQQDWWGTPQERTDPQRAAMLFLTGGTCPPNVPGYNSGAHVSGLLDKNWQTGDLPTVCQAVQRSGTASGSNYRAWQSTAVEIVTKLRTQISTGLENRSGNSVGGDSVNNGLPTGNTTFRAIGDQLAKVAHDFVASRPPGHVHYSLERGTTASDPKSDDPTRLDCSSFVSWVYYHTTGQVWGAGNANDQYHACPVRDIKMEFARNIRGCLLYGVGESDGSFGGHPGHTGIALGDGVNHVAAHQVTQGHLHDLDISPLPGGLYSGALAPGVDYTSAATTEAARAELQRILKKKCTLSTLPLSQIGDPSVSGSNGGSTSGVNDPFQQLVSAFASAPQVNGDIFGGARQLMNNQPFLPWLQQLTNSTMRAFCSAPNGDFIAWFPDYFNVWGTSAIMDIQLIELQDFTVEWSDQQIVTHEFVLGSVKPLFDGVSGGIVDGGTQDYTTLNAMLATEGIATMDFPQIFKTIYGKALPGSFVGAYLRRFGARPNVESMPNIQRGPQEFYMALWMFMKHWAEQFNATVPMTFMPELWPGMILRIKEWGFQAYVSEVTHRGSYGESGKFTTEVKIIAPGPTSPDAKSVFNSILSLRASKEDMAQVLMKDAHKTPPGPKQTGQRGSERTFGI